MVVILANGKFPTHPIPLEIIRQSKTVICCDGAAEQLLGWGRHPDYITGDLDSVSRSTMNQFPRRLRRFPDQNWSDLYKTLRWCVDMNYQQVQILGATGDREDHTIGNLFIALDFAQQLKVELITDSGRFTGVSGDQNLPSFIGQQVSLFSADPKITITADRLKYNINSINLSTLYNGILNESMKENIKISLSHGSILVYQLFGGLK